MAKKQKPKASVRFRSAATLLQASPLVMTESQIEFDRISDALEQLIKPDGIVEQMYVTDMAHFIWEILRLRRCKAQIINANLHSVILEIIGDRAQSESIDWRSCTTRDDIQITATEFPKPIFMGEEVNEHALQTIDLLGLDAAAIEAQAVRRSFSDLDRLERLLAALEARRDKALRRVAEYRAGLSQILRECSDRIIEGKVVALKGASIKKPATAA
jgi:hypothetical protein